MSFRISQSGVVGRPRFKASLSDLRFQARTVPGFGRGLALGFLGGVALCAIALGSLMPQLRVW